MGRLVAVKGYDPVAGYLQLGMPNEALHELDEMSDVKKKTERHTELLLAAQMMLQDWGCAVDTAKRLCHINETECGYFIHAAFCMHEVGDTLGAMRHLLSGPKALLKESLYHYNLACYHAVLDQFEPAQYSLSMAFDLDEELREVAKKDSDLAGLEF